MTVSTHLGSLSSGLVLSESEETSIARFIATLETRLNAYFGSGLSSHFQFGSSTRGTILPRKADSQSDVDYMVVFDPSSEGQKKPQTYLNRLKAFAEAKYSTSEIAQSSPTIVLSLNHIKFELVPAIHSYGYRIPAPGSYWDEWILTDPSGTNQAIQDKNKTENYQIKPLVRLVKYWNACKSHPFPSFSLEKYIVNRYYVGCRSLPDYFYSFWSVFSANHEARQNVKDMVASAKSHASKAKQYEDDGMPVSAEIEIKKIVPEI